MSKNILTKLIVIFFSFYFHSAQALVLTVQMPGGGSTFNTTVDSFFDVGIFIDDVLDLGGFDFKLTYDSTKLSALSLTSGSIFGAADTETFFNSIAPSAAPFYEIHFAEAISAFSSLSAGFNIVAPTLLGTVHFQALSTGVNNLLDITDPIVSDFNGDSIGGSKQGAFVTITDRLPAAVPLPTTAILFATGLLALFGLRKKANII